MIKVSSQYASFGLGGWHVCQTASVISISSGYCRSDTLIRLDGITDVLLALHIMHFINISNAWLITLFGKVLVTRAERIWYRRELTVTLMFGSLPISATSSI